MCGEINDDNKCDNLRSEKLHMHKMFQYLARVIIKKNFGIFTLSETMYISTGKIVIESCCWLKDICSRKNMLTIFVFSDHQK